MGDVEQRIRAQIEAATAAEAAGGWITYLVRDPRRPDLKGNRAGWPVYVGQSDEFGKRVRNHLRKSEKLARKGMGIKQRMKELLHAGVVPNFEVLDRQSTRLASLLSETNFARLCRTRGYDIANQTTLQNRAGPPVTKYELPTKWFWKFTLEQAVDDQLRVELVCSVCETSVELDVAIFGAHPTAPKTLEGVRDLSMWQDEPCGLCGKRDSRRIRVRVL